MSTRPAQLLGIEGGTLAEGRAADFALVDERAEYFYNEPLSMSRNSPWIGKRLRARVLATFVDGKPVYDIR